MFSRLTSFILGWKTETPDVTERPVVEPHVIEIEDNTSASEESFDDSLDHPDEFDFEEEEDVAPEPEELLCQYEVETLPELQQAELFCGECGTVITPMPNAIWFCIECDLYYMSCEDEDDSPMGGFCTCGNMVIPCDIRIETCEEGCNYWFEGEYEESLVVMEQEDDDSDDWDFDLEEDDDIICEEESEEPEEVEPLIRFDVEEIEEDDPMFITDEDDCVANDYEAQLDAELDAALAELDALVMEIPAPAPTPVDSADRKELTKEEFEERIESILRDLWPDDGSAFPTEDIWTLESSNFALPSVSVIDEALEEFYQNPDFIDTSAPEPEPEPEFAVPEFPRNFNWPPVEVTVDYDWDAFGEIFDDLNNRLESFNSSR